MAILTGLNASTAQELQLDAGIIMTGLTEETLDAFDWSTQIFQKGKCIGATKGGASFSAVPEIRNLLEDINGSRGVYKTGQVIDSWDITLKTTISEITEENLKLAMNIMADSGTLVGSYTKLRSGVGMIQAKHYNKNIAWVGKITGKTKPIVILLKDVLNTNGVNFTAEDKNSGGVEVEFKAHFDLAKPNDVPYAIYYPSN